MALAPLLQLRRMRVIQSSRDISLEYLAVLLAGFGLYFWYGLSIANRVLIVTNPVSIPATGLTLGVGVGLACAIAIGEPLSYETEGAVPATT